MIFLSVQIYMTVLELLWNNVQLGLRRWCVGIRGAQLGQLACELVAFPDIFALNEVAARWRRAALGRYMDHG